MTQHVYRVLIADDSAVMRRLLLTTLESEDDLRVVGTARDGAEAVRLCHSLRPDVVIMDLNMPVMDGLLATQKILEQAAVPIVVLSGYVGDPSSQMAFEAIRVGALAVVAKPTGPDEPEYRRMHDELVRAVRSMATVKLVARPPQRTDPIQPMAAHNTPTYVRAVGLVAATGGPAALHFILRRLPSTFPAPILIVQHITLGFVPGLVDWLSTDSKLDVRLAQNGEIPQPGQALFAPDDSHMVIGPGGTIVLGDEDPVDGQRPSGNLLFRSMARAYGAQAVGVVLTGLGADGANGLMHIKVAGGQTLAQDEDTSIVYGMPREAAALGAAQEVLPLDRIVAHLLSIAN
ncbi:MAG TPA: chemotaxis-specific protein-glutamate methyltransferase CheB [Chloroflexota bacterium]|nr:chemotaxis-specific protein-glutamate methyltransferase CheB [Chloroflexota bacterium]